ncbi:acetyl esterase [Rhizomicrobium palustre]|uniref:Acetyl esterase n=1 Tax=Rhizomicrobium palustre TaxID=189966 RepID=A0A846N099_9PROT|nr:alpha/beta hydrolase [Rhizomicrobium palustre]NIK89116.1 acetyl esterase [Rhizomicrobium palustre]
MPAFGPSRFLPAIDQSRTSLDVSAVAVIARLSAQALSPTDDPDEIRRRYSALRAPLTGEAEEVGRIQRIASPDGPPLIVVHPKNAAPGLLPGLVYFHGGGWVLGGFDTYGPFIRALANATGRVIVFVDYRLAPEHPFPAALEDAFAAIDFVSEHAAWLGIDAGRIAIGGDSAGGNLAAVAAIAARDGLIDSVPEAQLLIYPCLDFTASQPSHEELAEGYLLTRELYGWYRAQYQGSHPDPTDWRLSPLFAGDFSGLAPAILIYAGFDPLRDEALLYASRLIDAGVTVEPIFYPGMIHGFITMAGAVPAALDAVTRIAAALKKADRVTPRFAETRAGQVASA